MDAQDPWISPTPTLDLPPGSLPNFPSTNGWLAPARLPAEPGAAGPGAGPERAAMFELRPLTTGEVLDRTFTVYRSRFWLFVGIASIGAATQTVVSAVQLVAQHFLRHRMALTTVNGVAVLVGLVVGVLAFLAYSVTQAATVYAVSEIYLGRSTTIGESLRLTISGWYRYIAIALWQVGSVMWIPLVLILPAVVFLALKVTSLVVLGGVLIVLGMTGGLVAGVILYLRNSLAIPSAVIERLKIRASMRRSKTLAAGTKARIFLVLLISWCLYMVVGILQAPLAFLMMMASLRGGESLGSEAGVLLLGFLGHSVVTPVAMIGLTLVYFDQRVRKEAFDIAVLLGEEQGVATAPADATAAAAGDNGLAG